MFSLDAMTRGQHAITTATSQTSLPESGLSSSRSASSLATYGTWASSASGAARGGDKSQPRRGRRKSKSTTTLQMDQARQDDEGQSAQSNSIASYHGLGPASGSLKDYSRVHLNNFDRIYHISLREASREFFIQNGNLNNLDSPNNPNPNPNNNNPADNPNGLNLGSAHAGRFRYVVATLIILAVSVSAYASNTMYIAAIEMISNDVLQSGMTSLRAKHLSNDPLAINKNAALPGTCPKEASRQTQVAHLLQQQLLAVMNASEISAHERLAMQQDSLALYQDVNERLATGQLVDWTISQRGYIFTAHTLGTIMMAVPVSRLGLSYGSHKIVFVCILLASLRMLTLPTIAGHAPFWAAFVFELVIGGVGGNIVILGYPLAAAWLLPYEANFFIAINILASMIGIAATNFISTQLLSGGVDWCWCYYLPGAMLFLLSLAWYVWGADRPEASPFVARAELELLQSNTIAKRNESELKRNNALQRAAAEARPQAQSWTNHQDDEREQQKMRLLHKEEVVEEEEEATQQIPRFGECHCSQWERDSCPSQTLVRKPNWLTIFTCPTLWAIILTQFANHWTVKNATLWPTFFSNILHLSSSTIGIMLGIKGVWALIFGTIFAVVTRKLVDERPFNMSLTAYRRWNQAIAASIYVVSVVLLVFFDCSLLANFMAVLIQPLVSSFNSISHDQMPLDLSAEDSGLLVSVIRLFSIGDVVALPVAGFILSHASDALAGDRHTWRMVWLVGLAARSLASFYFVLVAKSRPKSYSRLEPAGACNSISSSATTTNDN